MRLFLSILILFGAAVTETVCSPTLSTIQGPSQGTSTTFALDDDEDCLSTIDWRDIVFIIAVPIAAGFGLLMLFAFLQDLRQACKSNHSWPSAPPTITATGAGKGRTYAIEVDYVGRSSWGSPLRWCAKLKSYAARKNLCLLRLRGTLGNSDWIYLDLALGEESEKRMITTSCTIGKLAGVETKYPSTNGTIYKLRQMPHLSIGAYIRGLINRACEIEIKNIHVLDTKTKDQFISDCCTSNSGISSSEQGITTLLPFTAKPAPRVNHFTYFIKNALLLTSTFIPWRDGNFTGVRHLTCIFACITSTMLAVEGVSMPQLELPLGDSVVARFTGHNVTLQLVVKALGVGVLVYPFVMLVEILFRCLPTVMSSNKTSPNKQQGSASHKTVPQYQPETESQTEDGSIPSHASSDILSGESSSQHTIQREISPPCLDGDIDNKKNDVTIIEIDPADDLPTGMQISYNESVSVATDTSSMRLNLDSSSGVTIVNIEDDVKTDQLFTAADSMSQSDLVQTKMCHRGDCAPVVALACHILLVGLSVLSLLGSMVSIHALCWDAFWDWAVTSVIAILTQIVVLDLIKAVGMTLIRACTNK